MEKIVAKQLNNYLLHFNILEQSGFRKFHRTESTCIFLLLSKVHKISSVIESKVYGL